MPRAAELTPQLSRYNFTENGVDQAIGDSWAPIPATEPSHPDDSFLREQEFGATTGDEHFFQPADEGDLRKILRDSGSQRKLIIGSVVAAALAIGVFAYASWPTALGKKDVQTAEAAPVEQSAPVAPIDSAAQLPEPTAAPAPVEQSAPVAPIDSAAQLPETSAAPSAVDAALPRSMTFDPTSQIAAAAPTGNSSPPELAPPWENPEIVFLQRPGVNIRSAAAKNGGVVGTAPKGTRFKVTSREADWVLVESGRLKGWINSQFLAPNEPR